MRHGHGRRPGAAGWGNAAAAPVAGSRWTVIPTRTLPAMASLRFRCLLVAALCLLLPASVAGAPRLVRANDVAIAYTETGSGPPLVLIHGFGDCGSAWEPFTAELGKHYRVIAMELRGHGSSADFEGPFLFEDSARDLLALLGHLGLDRVRAMGISAGGMTLLHAAVQAPGRIEAMAVIGAAHYFPEQAREIMRGTPGNLPPEVRAGFERCATRGAAQVDGLLQRFHGFKDNDDDIRLSPRELGTIQARTLIVHGDRDVFFPVDIPLEVYAAIPDAQLWIVPGGDHVPIYGHNQEAFMDTVLRFLAGTAP
ncbi:alpha/beta hydrolase [Luteimonas yindakuii]|uniref:Alpha/beta hydrolase n=2 Tax=Luteimonas yindakuii TaxID=2565782 RepID=A0A4Z1R2C9_9GAMM|nr:alpha/beta hydrolase [Luteimonas yindakuii]